jgi:hypothetical protein
LVLRGAPGHAVEESLFDLSHGNIFNPREILRLRPAPRKHRAKEKTAQDFAQDDGANGGRKASGLPDRGRRERLSYSLVREADGVQLLIRLAREYIIAGACSRLR